MIKLLAYTHVWIALGAAAAAAGAIMSVQPLATWNSWTWQGVGWLFFGTGLIYTLQRLIKFKRQPHSIPEERRVFLAEWKSVLIVGWLGSAAAGGLAIGLDWSQFTHLILTHPWPLFLVAVLALGYASNPFTGGRGWRDRPHLKWPVIAVTWGITTGWLPFEFTSFQPPFSPWLHAAVQTAFVAGITLPFDNRDIRLDEPRLRTVPQWGGLNFSTWTAAGLIALSMAGFLTIDPGWGRFGAASAALAGIGLSARWRSEWIYSVWLDGCLVLQGVLAFFTF